MATDPALTDPFMLKWQCLNHECKHIWLAYPHNPTRPGGTDMTKVQATYLQATWNELGFPLCEHLKLDLERSEDGYMTGNYRYLA